MTAGSLLPCLCQNCCLHQDGRLFPYIRDPLKQVPLGRWGELEGPELSWIEQPIPALTFVIRFEGPATVDKGAGAGVVYASAAGRVRMWAWSSWTLLSDFFGSRVCVPMHDARVICAALPAAAGSSGAGAQLP